MGNRSDDPNWNPRVRNQGNPQTRGDRREAGRVGIGDAGVIPTQASSVPSPRFFGAKYRLGAPIRPASIKFDNGFLDKFKKRSPTASDYLALAKWKAKLEVAESLRPDLDEACKAYRHFLEGNGRPRTFHTSCMCLTINPEESHWPMPCWIFRTVRKRYGRITRP